MKKVLTFCAAIVAAMTLRAEVIPMTCAEAAAAAALLEHNVPGTDSVAVTGYVTSTDGQISRGQQTFWLDDSKGETKTFEGYWCNLPADVVEANAPLNVGDKVTISGFLMRYNSTMEMKNGDVTILERAVVAIDTLEVDVCEAIEEGESLNDGDNTTDIFVVTGTVASLGQTNDTYHNQSFFMMCDDNQTTLQAYNVTIDTTEEYARLGDTVTIIGRLKKYGEQIEILGNCEIVGRAEVIIPDTIQATVAEAVVAGSELAAGLLSEDVYIVTGYVDSIVAEYNADYGNMSFYMCDDITVPTYNFQAYRCYGEEAVVAGDKVMVVGFLKNYVKDEVSTIEIEKGNYTLIITEGLESIMSEQGIDKLIINGQLYIRRENKLYNAQGMQF